MNGVHVVKVVAVEQGSGPLYVLKKAIAWKTKYVHTHILFLFI